MNKILCYFVQKRLYLHEVWNEHFDQWKWLQHWIINVFVVKFVHILFHFSFYHYYLYNCLLTSVNYVPNRKSDHNNFFNQLAFLSNIPIHKIMCIDFSWPEIFLKTLAVQWWDQLYLQMLSQKCASTDTENQWITCKRIKILKKFEQDFLSIDSAAYLHQ